MKKRLALITTIAVVLSFATGVVAKNVYETIKAQLRPDFVIEIDGEEKEFKNVNGERVYPVLYDGTTYLPIRAIGEIMDKKVYWYEDEKRIELRDKDDKNKDKTTVTDADVIITEDGSKSSKDDNSNSKDKAEKEPKEDKVKADKTYDDKNFIGQNKAKEIALNKAGLKESDVTYIKAELDKDGGVYTYEVEFKKDFREYSAEISAVDGRIIDWEVDFDD